LQLVREEELCLLHLRQEHLTTTYHVLLATALRRETTHLLGTTWKTILLCDWFSDLRLLKQGRRSTTGDNVGSLQRHVI
jgi:hypothetical protein